MRVLIVEESMFGNTARVAEAIEQALRPRAEVTRLDVADAPADPGPGIDLLVVGGPTHAFSLSRPGTRRSAVQQGAPAEKDGAGVREWLEALPEGRVPAVAAFGTKVGGGGWIAGSAAHAAARLARRRGAKVVGTIDLLVDGTRGPLRAGEAERAAAWAAGLVPAAVRSA